MSVGMALRNQNADCWQSERLTARSQHTDNKKFKNNLVKFMETNENNENYVGHE